MDWRPFRNIRKDGYDVMVVWDYRKLTFNWTPIIRKYDEICLVAWSMGVFAASLTIHEPLPRITKRIAVNGTLDPIHPTRGIPPEIFRGTLEGLSPHSLRKFYRRMCISPGQFATFMDNCPKRGVDELREELEAIETHTIFHVPQVREWDLALISRHDAIFGAENMRNAWIDNVPVQMMDAAHLPDFQQIVSRLFISKDRVRHTFGKSAETYSVAASPQQAIARRLLELARLCGMPQPIGTVLEIGAGDNALTSLYAPQHYSGTIHLWDLLDAPPAPLPAAARYKACDAEVEIRRINAESIDFLLSSSTIQWFNSPASFLREAARTLSPCGWLAFSTFTDGNLSEVSTVLGTGLPLPTANGWLGMIPDALEVVDYSTQEIVLTFDTPRQVLEHLRKTGVNAVDYGRNPATQALRLMRHLIPDANGKYTLTYRAVHIIARKH